MRNQESTKCCGTCLFWKEVDRFGVGTCEAIKHQGGQFSYSDDWAEGNNAAGIVDGSGYYAALKTKEAFGCTLYKPR